MNASIAAREREDTPFILPAQGTVSVLLAFNLKGPTEQLL
jgi:hypothetical protein